MFFTQNLYYENSKLLKKNNQIFLNSKEKLKNDIKNRTFGFLKNILKKDYKEVNKFSNKLGKFETILILGTGGSSLGGKTLISLADKKNKKNNTQIFFIENIDQDSITEIIKSINLKKTGLLVISKSGETLETLSQYFFIKEFMKRKKVDFQSRIFILTENKKSTLKKIQEENKFHFINHDKKIGGRYSIFSSVGLIPANVYGLKIKNLCEGGINFIKDLSSNNFEKFDELFLPTLYKYSLLQKNININIFMPYIDKMQNFSYWLRQLWAESVGKNGKGSTLVNALGTVDQHSQLQLYLDGPKDKFFTIIYKKDSEKKSDILKCEIGVEKIFNTLQNKSMKKLMAAEVFATIETIKRKKLPLTTISFNEINEDTIGSLLMYFFLETILFCYMLEVDPFDQPAVEEGKILTKEILINE